MQPKPLLPRLLKVAAKTLLFIPAMTAVLALSMLLASLFLVPMLLLLTAVATLFLLMIAAVLLSCLAAMTALLVVATSPLWATALLSSPALAAMLHLQWLPTPLLWTAVATIPAALLLTVVVKTVNQLQAERKMAATTMPQGSLSSNP